MRYGMPGNREGGAILIVTLLFLVILTMLGVTAMTGTTMEERMAGNTRDSAIALQAAEAALRDARRDLSRIEVSGTLDRPRPLFSDWGNAGAAGTCSAIADYRGLCLPANNPDGTIYNPNPGSVLPSTPAHSLLAAPSVQFGDVTNAPALGGVAVQPRYLMELFCLQESGNSIGAQLSDTCVFYRITARGYGRNPNTFVTLQEVFVSHN